MSPRVGSLIRAKSLNVYLRAVSRSASRTRVSGCQADCLDNKESKRNFGSAGQKRRQFTPPRFSPTEILLGEFRVLLLVVNVIFFNRLHIIPECIGEFLLGHSQPRQSWRAKCHIEWMVIFRESPLGVRGGKVSQNRRDESLFRGSALSRKSCRVCWRSPIQSFPPHSG